MTLICVFCSSSSNIDEIYTQAAEEIVELLERNEMELVWGGANVGMMGKLAKHMQEIGGRVHGIVPKVLVEKGLEYQDADELIITKDLSMRKQVMSEISNGFIALPGGMGTLEELTEMITLKQLGLIDKPIIILNIGGYYDYLMRFVEVMITDQFMKEEGMKLFDVVNTPEEVFESLMNYKTGYKFSKW